MTWPEEHCVILFTRYPEKGRVKTRLAETLDEEFVVALCRNFILDTCSRVGSLGYRLLICFCPETRTEDMVRWLGTGYDYLPQQGKDLGERMMNGFLGAFSRDSCKVILIGSDCPDLPLPLLREAFLSLDIHDTVLGPASDGGYYLIGFTRDGFFPGAFRNIGWGTETVFQETLSHLEKAGRVAHVLPVWHDTDTVEDLKRLVARNRENAFRSSRTMGFLLENTTKLGKR